MGLLHSWGIWSWLALVLTSLRKLSRRSWANCAIPPGRKSNVWFWHWPSFASNVPVGSPMPKQLNRQQGTPSHGVPFWLLCRVGTGHYREGRVVGPFLLWHIAVFLSLLCQRIAFFSSCSCKWHVTYWLADSKKKEVAGCKNLFCTQVKVTSDQWCGLFLAESYRRLTCKQIKITIAGLD